MARTKKLRVLRVLFCDFCGRSQADLDLAAGELLVAGRDGVHICTRCVAICVDLINKDTRKRSGPSSLLDEATQTSESE